MADFTKFSELDNARLQMVVPLKSGGFVVAGANGVFSKDDLLTRTQMLERLAEIFPEVPDVT